MMKKITSIFLAIIFSFNVFSSSFMGAYADENIYENIADESTSEVNTSTEDVLVEDNSDDSGSSENEENSENDDIHSRDIESGKNLVESDDSQSSDEDSEKEKEDDSDKDTEEKINHLSKVVDGREISVDSKDGFPKNAELIVAKIPLNTAKDIVSAEKNGGNRDILFAYDIKIVVDGKKYDVDENSPVNVSIKNIDSIEDGNFELLHIKKDLVDNSGNLLNNDIKNIVSDLKNNKVDTEDITADTDGNDVNFDLNSFSVIIGSQDGAGIETSISYRKSDQDVKVDFSTDENKEAVMGQETIFNLNIKATFPDGSLVLKVHFKKSIPRIDIGVSKIWLNEDNNLSKPSDISGYYVVAELWRRDTSIDDSEGEKVSEKILTSDGEKHGVQYLKIWTLQKMHSPMMDTNIS